MSSESDGLLGARPLIIAHRGASGELPEHTLEAYARAIEQGADYIEPDLVSTKDGVLVARHENEISGTTDVAILFPERKNTKIVDGVSVEGWFVEDLDFEELTRVRAVQRLSFRDSSFNRLYSIPTFDDVLSLADSMGKARGRSVGVYPETKHPSYFRSIGLPLEESMLRSLDRIGWNRADAPVFIQSFEIGNLRHLSETTDVRLIQLVAAEDSPDRLLDATLPSYQEMLSPDGLRDISLYAHGIGPEKSLVLAKGGVATGLVEDSHAAGLKVHIWTIRKEKTFIDPVFDGDVELEIEAFIRAGVDGVFTDHTHILVRLLSS